MGRSYHSILQLENEFSYPMLVSCLASHMLPFRLRAAFTNLLVNLYVDRYPQQPLRMPETIQILHNHNGEIEPKNADIEPKHGGQSHAIPFFEIKDPKVNHAETLHGMIFLYAFI